MSRSWAAFAATGDPNNANGESASDLFALQLCPEGSETHFYDKNASHNQDHLAQLRQFRLEPCLPDTG